MTDQDRIAIIGMAGRFPGAGNIGQFWDNLAQGVCAVTTLSSEELAAAGVDPEESARPDYVAAGAFLDDADRFDARFFGINPNEARLIDPQQRLFLECAWTALDDAGYDPDRHTGSIGVFGGVARNTYLLDHVDSYRALIDQGAIYEAMLGSEKDFVATRVSFKLNLRGPSITVQSACSTSGVAIHLACQSLLNGECDMALAGGARVRVPLRAGYIHVDGGITSPDGLCRAFDADANGCVYGSGVGIVVLKLLEDALADRDTISAVILGSALNNDGVSKVGFTAPSISGQAAVIREAMAVANVEPDTIGYVETHGTGTSLGDPIEIAALAQAYRNGTTRTGYCAIGSVKTNIGHLDAGAGVTAVIKAALSLRHGKIPPSLNFTRPNPQLRLEASPFFVNTELRNWDAGSTPHRAAVSSFGLGGTNFHAVLEEAPPISASGPSRPCQILTVAARDATALDEAASNLADHLERRGDTNLADVAYTLHLGRRAFPHRSFVVAHSSEEVTEAIRARDHRRFVTGTAFEGERAVAFAFPGGGAQYPGMARGLWEHEPHFRQNVDACLEALDPAVATDVRELLGATEPPSSPSRFEKPSVALPALFAVEYGLAQLWRSWGVEPKAMIGHSMGEYAAACIGGVMRLEDALALVLLRGRLFETVPAGAMLSVPLSEDDLVQIGAADVSIAAVNGPSSCVAAGTDAAIAQLENALSARGLECTRLHIRVAAHSHLIDPILPEFREFLRTVTLSPPTVPLISNVTGTWMTEAQATDPEYWVEHLRRPVRFAAGLGTLLEVPGRVLLEVGPGQTLSTFARRHPAREPDHLVAASLRHPKELVSDDTFLMNTLGRMWVGGVSVDWPAFHAGETRHRVPLPTYPFQRQRFWFDAPAGRPAPSRHPDVPAVSSPPVQPEDAGTPVAGAVTARQSLIHELRDLLHQLSGLAPDELDENATFLELGFDSLFLTRANTAFNKRFGVKIPFRALFEDAPTVAALAEYIEQRAPERARASLAGRQAPIPVTPSTPQPDADAPVTLENVARQIESLAKQIEVLRDGAGTVASSARGYELPRTAVARSTDDASSHGFGPFKPVKRVTAADLDAEQQGHLDSFIAEYNQRTQRSKAAAQQHRPHMADPRTVSGFRRPWKEVVYPIVAARSAGSRIWDVDDNEYIDITMGFGAHLFGHSPAFLVRAVQEQLERGFELGPQSPLAGRVAQLLCGMTGTERMTFCQTGSEAVLGALRAARTVTGKDRIALFAGAYHGRVDCVVARPVTADGRRYAVPQVPGIPQHMVNDVLILDYGDPSSLEVVREYADELAAVLVEPVQSRNPSLQPREFLHALRRVTTELDVALIFDEIITGFRVHPGGAQAWYGVEADLITYGKSVGGGMPMAVLAGRAEYLDAFDGGAWQFGDDSIPEAGVTFLGGTFIRHPMALASALAVLEHMEEQGPDLQARLNDATTRFASSVNEFAARDGVPLHIEHWSSLFTFRFDKTFELAGLFFPMLRSRGVHVYEDYPCFLSTAHSDQDIETITQAIRETIGEMRRVGFLPMAPDAGVGGPVRPPTPSEVKPDPVGAPVTRQYPMTASQEEIWLGASLSDGASCAFNLCTTFDFSGPVNAAALREALQTTVDRHDALRVTFAPDGGYVSIADRVAVELPVEDLSALTEGESETRVREAGEAECRTPFSLAHGPLVRARLLVFDPRRSVLLLTLHHIVCDGFSLRTVIRDFNAAFDAAVNGGPELRPVTMQYSAYIDWIEAQRTSAESASAETFYHERFDPLPPALELPTDRIRPSWRTFECGEEHGAIGADTTRALQALGAQNGASLFVVLLATVNVWMRQLTGQEDIVIGIPFSGQSIVGEDELVGHCVNMHPFRTTVAGFQSFTTYLNDVQQLLLDTYEFRNYTYGSLLKSLRVPREPNRAPLFTVQFNYENGKPAVAFAGLETLLGAPKRAYHTHEFALNFRERDAGIEITCWHNRDLYDPETIAAWLDAYSILLRRLLETPAATVAQLGAVPLDEERDRALHHGAVFEVPEVTVAQMVETQAQRTPEACAVRYGEREWSYADLIAQSGSIATALKDHGVSRGSLVGIALSRSPEMVASVLAVWKAGAAYVPLDPEHPRPRIAMILEDSRPTVLLTQRATSERMPDSEAAVITVEDALAAGNSSPFPEIRVEPDDPAYIIFTSGSTGRPKGVVVPHRALTNFMCSMSREPGCTATDRLLAVTTLSFDISLLELVLPLTVGGSVVVASDEDLRDGESLRGAVEAARPTVMQATPAMWRMLFDAGWHGDSELKALCGGEALPPPLATQLVSGAREVWNMYGPTETTIWSACYRVRRGGESVPVGRPIGNTEIRILDRDGNAVPVAVPGELCIGGAGLADGYLGQPALTAERFVPHPHDPARLLYRTGDLARQRADGQFEFLQRLDKQVKIRGFRVELGEVETALAAQPAVKQAVVVARQWEPGDVRLIAYVVYGPGPQPTVSEVRRFARTVLPDYMVPGVVVPIEAIPLTPNGKTDRDALPDPFAAQGPDSEEHEPPTTATERLVALAWQDVLPVHAVGKHDNFFELGGHSLLAMKVVSTLRQHTGRPIDPRLMFFQTVEQIAAHVDGSASLES